jgi:hypothetical protein
MESILGRSKAAIVAKAGGEQQAPQKAEPMEIYE